VNYNGYPIDHAVPVMGEVFRDAGYDTAYSGKWHLPYS
jgi:arylsulfatase A-like enzyme